MTGWETITAHLLTYLPTLDGLDAASVFRGAVDSKAQLLNYVTVGHDGTDEGNGGFFDITGDSPDAMDREDGQVLVRFVSRSGDVDLTDRSSTANGWVDALRAHFAADRTLGGVLRQGSTVHVGRVEVRGLKTSKGAAMDLLAAVDYTIFQ